MSLSAKEIEEIAAESAEDALCKLNLKKPAAAETINDHPEAKEDDPYARLKPMRQWMEEKLKDDSNAEECKPCILGPVVNWYYTELQEQGKTEDAKALETMVDDLDEEDTNQLLELCSKMDQIKETIGEPLSSRLRDFDCEIQNLDLNQLEKDLEETEPTPAEPENASP
jgi:hypothetical protein